MDFEDLIPFKLLLNKGECLATAVHGAEEDEKNERELADDEPASPSEMYLFI